MKTKIILSALMLVGSIGLFPAESLAALNGKWIGGVKYVSSMGGDELYADCLVTLEETEKTLTIRGESCGKYVIDSMELSIVAGNQLFINGLRIGNLTKNGFTIDFVDYSQGYKNHLMVDVSILRNELFWYKSLRFDGYLDYVVGKLKETKTPSK